MIMLNTKVRGAKNTKRIAMNIFFHFLPSSFILNENTGSPTKLISGLRMIHVIATAK